jgi:hypothetical protein
MDLKWQDGAIPGKKLKKPSRTPEEVSQAKKQYEQKRSNEKKNSSFSGKNIFGLVTLASHWPRCLVVKKVFGKHCNNHSLT